MQTEGGNGRSACVRSGKQGDARLRNWRTERFAGLQIQRMRVAGHPVRRGVQRKIGQRAFREGDGMRILKPHFFQQGGQGAHVVQPADTIGGRRGLLSSVSQGNFRHRARAGGRLSSDGIQRRPHARTNESGCGIRGPAPHRFHLVPAARLAPRSAQFGLHPTQSFPSVRLTGSNFG